MRCAAALREATRCAAPRCASERAKQKRRYVWSGRKNAGEQAGDGFHWEQPSKYGDSEIIVRFELATPATKKDVKVVFKAKELKVTVAGAELMSSKLFGTITIDESTWTLVEKGSELQVLLALAEDTKWKTLVVE